MTGSDEDQEVTTTEEASNACQHSDLAAISERDWEKMLTLLREGRVIPVIGPELLSVDHPTGVTRLYDLWGEALAKSKNIPVPTDREGTPLLYRVGSLISMNRDFPQGDLEYEVDRIIRSAEWPLPGSLRLLAKIEDFPLYVTTTIDHMMKVALQQETAGATAVNHISFNRGGNTAKTDLSADFSPRSSRTVFHLFGATSTDTEGFAATEDALIEFSWSLIDHDYAPKHLYEFLRKKMILLLGCDFPDWLERFFIHALTRKSDMQITLAYVSACRTCGLRDYLSRQRAMVLPPVSAVDFVAELHRRWSSARGDAATTAPARQTSIPTKAKKGSVFVSYCREDHDAAAAIRSQLDAAGIDTWMDETGLEPGDAFREVIRSNIEDASFFIAVISRALDLSGTDRTRRFVFKEWRWAEDANEEHSRNMNFLLPVAVDDTPRSAPFVDRCFRDAHWTDFRHRRLPEDFIDLVKNGVRRFRSESGGGLP